MTNAAQEAADRVRIEIHDGIAEVTLTRAEKMNALDLAMFEAINAAAADLVDPAERGEVRAVVLAGDGRAFSAGIDLTLLGDPDALTDLGARTHGQANFFQQVAWGWRTLPVPVVAALHGVVFGGGLQIALGADLRIAHPATRLAVMEARWGLVPDMAGFPLLRELVRGDVARELVYTGREVDAAEAERIGLVTRLADDPRAAALDLARQIADNSAPAVRAAKRIFETSLGEAASAAEVLLAESREQQALLESGEPHRRLAAMAQRG